MPVAREKLYDEVWTEPMTTVAKRYSVSSVYLARICEQLGVPRPPRGYWQQHAAGAKLEREPLPDPEPGSALEWVRDGHDPRRSPPAAPNSVGRPTQRRGPRPDKHPLLVGARAHFDHAREPRDNEYVRSFKRSLVDIFVSREALERALMIASDLFLALEDRGQRVMLAHSSAGLRHIEPRLRVNDASPQDYFYYSSTGRWSPSQPTVTYVGEVAIGLSLFEISEEVEARYDSKLRKYVSFVAALVPAKPARRRGFTPVMQEWISKRWLPSGRLGVHAFAPYEGVAWEHYWYETADAALPSMFETIATHLERAAPNITKLVAEALERAEQARREREVEHAAWLWRMEESERKAAEQRRIEAEARREKDFEQTIARWRFARDIREYVSDAKAIVHDAGLRMTPGSEDDRHVKWALALADKLDPLQSLRAEVAKVGEELAAKPPRRQRRPRSRRRPGRRRRAAADASAVESEAKT